MRRRVLFCFFLLFFVLKFGFSQEKIHTIQRGETIYSIARSYGVKAADLLALNGIGDPRRIQAGQRIRIPQTGQALPGRGEEPAAGEYRVEKNDTLYSLARRYGVSVAELLDMNGFSPSYVLKAGERIRVPAQGQAPASGLALSGGQPGPAAGAGGAGASRPAAGTGNGAVSVPVKAPVPADTRWPVIAKEVSYITGKLYGVQVTGERREPVRSLTQGTVVSAGPYRGFGRVAIVQMTGGYLYVYGGCESLSVKEGDKVAPGTELGKLGVDIKSEKPQLFFFVYRSNNPIDPATAPRA
ncbi:MAG: M23 family metallopeptidase [Treponema sp.]|jgi:murein DD-endopeptidase MepM/ murein hydrolase activator NlpD|nr:M23 family metallopeptidase [Treponema sp.]